MKHLSLKPEPTFATADSKPNAQSLNPQGPNSKAAEAPKTMQASIGSWLWAPFSECGSHEPRRKKLHLTTSFPFGLIRAALNLKPTAEVRIHTLRLWAVKTADWGL